MNVLFLKLNEKQKEKINQKVIIPTSQNIDYLYEKKIIKDPIEFKKYIISNNIKKIFNI